MDKRSNILFSMLPLLIEAQAAFAISNVAVLELIPSANAQEISIDESRHLTNELRKQAVEILPGGEYSVLTRDNIMALMPADEETAERIAESGAVEIGRAIGAEYVSSGALGKFGKKLTVSVELYETASRKLISSMIFESEDIDGLLSAIRSEAKPLFQKILNLNLNPAKEAPSARKSAQAPRVPQWVGIGLSVAGIGMGVYGIFQESEYKKLHDKYMEAEGGFAAKWNKAENAKSRRNLGYIIGSALLASGVTIYFVF